MTSRHCLARAFQVQERGFSVNKSKLPPTFRAKKGALGIKEKIEKGFVVGGAPSYRLLFSDFVFCSAVLSGEFPVR